MLGSGDHSIPGPRKDGLRRDQGPGLIGWTTPLKKAASDGVGASEEMNLERPWGCAEEAWPQILGVLCASANCW